MLEKDLLDLVDKCWTTESKLQYFDCFNMDKADNQQILRQRLYRLRIEIASIRNWVKDNEVTYA